MKKPLVLFLVVGIMMSGCATQAVWEDAGRTVVAGPRVVGVEPAVAGGGAGRAVVRYWLGCRPKDDAGGQLDVALPRGADGGPEERYVYRGEGRTVRAIIADLPEARRRAIAEAVLPRVAPGGERRAGAVAVKSRAAAVKSEAPAASDARRTWVAGVRSWSPTYYASRAGGWDPEAVVVVVGSPDAARAWPDVNDAEGLRVLDGETVLLLPATQPRPKEDLDRARFVAALLTPPAVAVDAALTGLVVPLVLIMIVSGYHDC